MENMKYTTYSKDNIGWNRVYCENDDTDNTIDLLENVGRKINRYCGKFNASEHTSLNCNDICNDDKLFILLNDNNEYELWQLGGKVTDMNNVFVPHLYYVRQIGKLFK